MKFTKLTTLIIALTIMTTGLFAQSQVYVNGYIKSNGTYVAPHYRTAPDSNPYNNYSYPGNYNPNKGTITQGSQSSYLNNYYNSSRSSSSYGSSSNLYNTNALYGTSYSIWD